MEQRSESRPSPPATGSVSIDDCLQEILKFLFSHQTLDLALGLSKDYSSHLLTYDDDHHLNIHDILGDSEGVPSYPLYKHLASTLHQSLTAGALYRPSRTMTLIQENESLRQKETEWSKLILDKGSQLINMLKAVDFEIHVQEPFFSQLEAGLKTVEGRCAVGDYNRIAPGSLLLVNKCLFLEVQHIKRYASFAEMVEVESLTRVLPGVQTIEEGVQVYRKFYTEEEEKSNGVLAICVSRSNAQPYKTAASIIRGLSYDGIGALLGLVHTAGTVPDALPPPRSTLLTSFIAAHNPNVAP